MQEGRRRLLDNDLSKQVILYNGDTVLFDQFQDGPKRHNDLDSRSGPGEQGSEHDAMVLG
jgi:hypothetical protein